MTRGDTFVKSVKMNWTLYSMTVPIVASVRLEPSYVNYQVASGLPVSTISGTRLLEMSLTDKAVPPQ